MAWTTKIYTSKKGISGFIKHFELSPDGIFNSGGNTINPQSYLGITGDNTTSLPRPV